MKRRKLLAFMLTGVLSAGMSLPGLAEMETELIEHMDPASQSPELDLSKAVDDGIYSWTPFDENEDGIIDYYYLADVLYCKNITTPAYQNMYIYVPASYMQDENGTVVVGPKEAEDPGSGYTSATAPVIFANECSGWKSGKPLQPGGWFSIRQYTSEGFIYISCGARSRDDNEETDSGFVSYGKAPTPIADLKSGIIFLKANADYLPGNMERIISVGTSGGGEMSSVLGASGNMEEYYPYLYENGAVGVTWDEASDTYDSEYDDAVYGCQCYCPIADIENADMAYAWMHYDDGNTRYLNENSEPAELTAFQLELQTDLAYSFAQYINSLGLTDENGNALTFDENEDGTLNLRSGSYYDAVLKNMTDALNAYLNSTDESARKAYKDMLLSTNTEGSSWLREEEDGSLTITDMAGFMNAVVFTSTDFRTHVTQTQSLGEKRNKDIPGFDTFWMTAEGNAFGSDDEEAVHFSTSVAKVLEDNYDKYKTMDGFADADVDDYIQQALHSSEEDYIDNQEYLMNALRILLDDAAGSQDSVPAKYFRTRNGTADEHTSFTIAWNICLASEMAGSDADYSLVWAMTHGHQEGTSTGTFVEWVNEICRK